MTQIMTLNCTYILDNCNHRLQNDSISSMITVKFVKQ